MDKRIIYMTDELARRAFPPRDPDANKGDFGYIALVGGSLPYSGAIRLADRACERALAACSQAAAADAAAPLPTLAGAAMRSGAGVCSIAAPRSICRLIAPQILEATLFPLSESGDFFAFVETEFAALARRCRVIAFGMGIGNTAETKKAVRWLLANYDGILILDADGLNALAELLREEALSIRPQTVLTPHLKEFSRLSGISVDDAKKDPQTAAAGLAARLGAVVLLKGRTTYVADGRAASAAASNSAVSSASTAGIPVYASRTGTPGMATAGSGDVLSGILAALAAQNPGDLPLAAAAAAYINGLAGELAAAEHGEVSMLAGDTASCVERAILRL